MDVDVPVVVPIDVNVSLVVVLVMISMISMISMLPMVSGSAAMLTVAAAAPEAAAAHGAVVSGPAMHASMTAAAMAAAMAAATPGQGCGGAKGRSGEQTHNQHDHQPTLQIRSFHGFPPVFLPWGAGLGAVALAAGKKSIWWDPVGGTKLNMLSGSCGDRFQSVRIAVH